MIPITKPCLDECEIRAAEAVIRSGWLTQGKAVAAFERAVADYCGTAHAVAVSSCTTALHLSLVSLGIGAGDEVICPSMSFIATANAIRHAGAVPIFADVDPCTFNLQPEAAEAALTPRTRAILVVHQVGMPADLDRFSELGRRRGVHILEDAACAIGSRYKGRPIGGHSVMACFSFHPRKVLTTGEGGIITTNDDAHAERLRLLRQHGMSINDVVRHQADRVVIEEYLDVGYNYRMTDIQAALGIEQMKKLAAILSRRRWLAHRYSQAFAAHPWITPPQVPEYAEPNFQSYPVHVHHPTLSRNELMQLLCDQKIMCRRGIMLAHHEPPYRETSARFRLPNSEWASANTMLLPLYPDLTEAEQERIIAALSARALAA